MKPRIIVTLEYEIDGYVPDALRSLTSSFAPRQGTAECISGCGPNGHYEANLVKRDVEIAK